MKNIQMALAMLLIIGSTSLNAQSKKYKIEGTKCQRVEIIDAGELCSTYELNDPDKLKSYVVYKVVTLEDKIILVAPLKYNKDKDNGWALSRDVFFVMSTKAIK